ncbi:MAG: hypothetical protein CSB24_07440 [Deltaproteobacteria bacterium]|nr:MAG: hypothetical protein CSB24_07440 [Deltaproteobacteria bacterium]
MLDYLTDYLLTAAATAKDVLPVILLVVFFQVVVLRKSIPRLPSVILGMVFVILGLAMFLQGLELALFPLGRLMADQLASPKFIAEGFDFIKNASWDDFYWVYIFAFLIGFATTIAEPSLLAVAIKAAEVSSGTISKSGLRISVALGVAIGITLGTFRIVTGTPLYLYILAGYIVVVIQTMLAPKKIIPLAYDSGGVTTSTVTVPIVAALGLGLAEAIPGRNPVLDGFGLIAFASLFPIISVMAYAQQVQWLSKYKKKKIIKENKDAI